MSELTRSAISTSKDLESALSQATSPEQVKALMHQAAFDRKNCCSRSF